MTDADFCIEDEEKGDGVESPKHCMETQPGRFFQSFLRSDQEVCAMIETKHKELVHKIDHQSKMLELILLSAQHRVSKPKESGTINGSRRSSTASGLESKTSAALIPPTISTDATETKEVKQEDPKGPATGSRRSSQQSRNSNTSGLRTKGEAKANEEAPKAAQRPSFTPQLFKTFSQQELTNKKKAHAASVRRSASMESGLYVFEEVPPNWAKRMVQHSAFDLVFTFVVLTNSIFIGVELQMALSHPGGSQTAVQTIQYLYTALFTIELLIRIAADGCHLFCGEDWAWGVLDLFIVLFSLWEVSLDLIYLIAAQDGQSGFWSGFSNLKAFRIIRITRLVKAVRLARIFRFVMAFRLLISSILHTLKSLFWALMLLVLIIYVFAVLFTQAVNDHITDPEAPILEDADLQATDEYFGSLAATMLSLFMSISGGVSWENVISPLKKISTAWVVVYLFYISFTYFAVLNVVTAVFCQSAIDGAQNDHASKVHAILANKEQHLLKIQTLFQKFGAEGGVITFEQFSRNLKAAEVREYFQTLGLDVWDAWSFFKLLDEDGGGEVEIEEFLMGCLRLRGQATAMDVGKIINDQTWQIRNQGKFQAYVEVELKQLKEHLAILTGVNLCSDEHIGLIFGDHTHGVGKTRSIESVGRIEDEGGLEDDLIAKQVRDYSSKFDRRISP